MLELVRSPWGGGWGTPIEIEQVCSSEILN